MDRQRVAYRIPYRLEHRRAHRSGHRHVASHDGHADLADGWASETPSEACGDRHVRPPRAVLHRNRGPSRYDVRTPSALRAAIEVQLTPPFDAGELT